MMTYPQGAHCREPFLSCSYFAHTEFPLFATFTLVEHPELGNLVAVRDGDHNYMREGGAHDNIVDRVFRLRVARFTGDCSVG